VKIQIRPIERTGYLVGMLLLASGLIHLAILIVGGGSWQGPVSLRKPMTFGLSFGLTLITIVWVSSFLQIKERTRSLLLGIFAIACIVETALVSLQAWRGVPSHFNMETSFDAMIARTLAGGGIVIVAIIIALTLAAFRRNAGVPDSLRMAIQAGFVALLFSMVTGALMIAKGMRLVFAGNPQAAYASGGAFKATHAVAMLGILLLPLIAWLLSFGNMSEQQRRRLVVVAAAVYFGLVIAVAATNLAGF